MAVGAAHSQMPVRAVRASSIDINIAGISVGFEQPLGGTFTFAARLGLQAGLSYAWNIYDGGSFYYSLHGAISVEPRWYYNFRRRLLNGRSIRANSGNYLSVEAMYLTPPIARNNDGKAQGFLLTPMWGMRRVWPSRLFLEFAAGVEVYFISWDYAADADIGAGPRLSLRFGYSF